MQHIATVCFGQGADCCWDETVSRPKPTLSNRLEAGSNVQVTCLSARKGPQRQLSHPANANSRLNADLRGFGFPTAGF